MINGSFLESKLGSLKYKQRLWEGKRERDALKFDQYRVMAKGDGFLRALRLSFQRLGLF